MMVRFYSTSFFSCATKYAYEHIQECRILQSEHCLAELFLMTSIQLINLRTKRKCKRQESLLSADFPFSGQKYDSSKYSQIVAAEIEEREG